jgi:hypothetical protein
MLVSKFFISMPVIAHPGVVESKVTEVPLAKSKFWSQVTGVFAPAIV